jgi:hypothetical protein
MSTVGLTYRQINCMTTKYTDIYQTVVYALTENTVLVLYRVPTNYILN